MGTEQEDKQKSMREKGKIVHKIKRTEQEAMDRKQGERKGCSERKKNRARKKGTEREEREQSERKGNTAR